MSRDAILELIVKVNRVKFETLIDPKDLTLLMRKGFIKKAGQGRATVYYFKRLG